MAAPPAVSAKPQMGTLLPSGKASVPVVAHRSQVRVVAPVDVQVAPGKVAAAGAAKAVPTKPGTMIWMTRAGSRSKIKDNVLCFILILISCTYGYGQLLGSGGSTRR